MAYTWDFTGTNGDAISTTNADITKHSSSSSTNIIHADNRGRQSNGAGTTAYVVDGYSPSSADYKSEIDCYINGLTEISAFYVFARLTSSSVLTGYAARLSINGTDGNALVRLYEFTTGTGVQIGSDHNVTVSDATSYRLGVSCNGTSISAEWEGSAVISVTDASIAGPTFGGLRYLSTANNPATGGIHIDNLNIEELGGGGGFQAAWAAGANKLIQGVA